ncbi:putative hydrolase or acyltransferase of alpha/beta superfamily [Prauserella sp. Am3]|nr:putative hydrolase or acyltransferase of alpha/beta superfamily [Prauserella sp. Am3]
MLTATASDGTEVHARDMGRGTPVVLVLHPGMDDGTSWEKVGTHLSRRFRVVIPHRPRYRPDLSPGVPVTTEVDHVCALIHAIDAPILLVGHSSGAVVALETLVTLPSSFVGAVLYDPPIVTAEHPLGMPTSWRRKSSVARARAAVAQGRMRRAFAIHAREILKLPRGLAALAALLAGSHPRWRSLIPAQIEDAAAIEELGDRLSRYAEIAIPTVLLSGRRQQGDLHARLSSLQQVMPDAHHVLLPGQSHSAHRKAPTAVADVIERLADRVA